MTFAFEDDLLKQTGLIRRRAGAPAPVAVVDALLDKMLEDPDRFADGLRKISTKMGSVMLPRAQAAELRDTAARLQKMVEGLA